MTLEDSRSANSPELDALIESAFAGDAAAVHALIERNLPGLRAYVRLRCGPAMRLKESTSDIVQSTCRDVLENVERFRYRGEAGFRAWLFATAMRKIADRAEYWGAAKRAAGREVPLHDEERSTRGVRQLYASICSPSQEAMGNEAAERLEAAFDRLSDDEREVIVLARVVGLTHTELAEQLGISVAASRTRLFRALASLSQALGEASPSS
ncbi:MAG: sigma-70 family RNA polymerase sigma factor [Planctomycetes bacterium]|nr:sigma-70 family RNA polymerase sigma factor [Planctomycetota bacterium]